MKEDNLPQYWIVRNDHTERFRNYVIKYINSKTGLSFNPESFSFYGYDGSKNTGRKGFEAWNSLGQFLNHPTLLTLDEFIRLSECKNTETVEYDVF